jgi:hypothetical protein
MSCSALRLLYGWAPPQHTDLALLLLLPDRSQAL